MLPYIYGFFFFILELIITFVCNYFVMCLNPVHITLNGTRYFSRVNSVIRDAFVPCGHCHQCVMQSKSDLQLRSLAEYNDCINSGGVVLFLTFTYNEDSVPYFRYYLDSDGVICFESVSRYDQDCHTLMSFDKTHMQLYLKNLREYVHYHFGLRSQLRYLVTSEYGSSFTQRPHYHSLFFVGRDLLYSLVGKYNIDNNDFVSCNKVLKFFSSFWDFGIVSASEQGLLVNSDRCISYVSKYVCKTSDLLNYSRFSGFYSYICEKFSDMSFTPSSSDSNFFRGSLRIPLDSRSRFNTPISFFNYYVRKQGCNFYNVKSLNFGLSMVDSLRYRSPSEIVNKLNLGIPRVHYGKTSYYKYPRYVVRKLFYNNRSDGSYYLNELGMKTLDLLRISRIDSMVESVKKFDFSLFNRTPISVFQFDPYISQADLLSHVSESFDFLKSNPEPIFVYGSLLRGRLFPVGSLSIVHDLFNFYYHGSINLNDFVQHVSDYIDKDLCEYDEFELPDSSLCLSDYLDFYNTKSDYLSLSALGDSKFLLFEFALDNWNALCNYHSNSVLSYFDDQNKSTKLVKDSLNSRIYD